MDGDWVTERSEAIGDACRQLLEEIVNDAVAGDLVSGQAKARELGAIIGKLAARCYGLQMIVEPLLPAETRAAYAHLLEVSRLPTE